MTEPVPIHDYSQFQDTPDDSKLAELTKLANRQAESEAEVARLKSLLTTANEQLRAVAEQELPALMDQLGFSDFKTTTGLKITIRETIRASIPKARADEAFNWLDEHGHAAIVKRQFVASFGRDEEKWARKFAADLRRRKREVSVEDLKKVESSTLRAFVKAQLEDGADIPLELFGVFRQRISKIG